MRDKEWEARVRLIMDDDEEEEVGPAEAPLPTVMPAIDWSQTPTEEQRLQSIVELGSAGLISSGEVMRQFGLSPADLNRSVNNLDREGVVLRTLELRVGAIKPGELRDIDYTTQEGRTIGITMEGIVPGAKLKVRFWCGECRETTNRELASWQSGALLSSCKSSEQLRAAIKRVVDSGCPDCQRAAIQRAAENATGRRNSLGDLEIRHNCAVCGVALLNVIRDPDAALLTRRDAQCYAVCRDCCSVADPTVYNQREGLLP